jgi:hypothetical protein
MKYNAKPIAKKDGKKAFKEDISDLGLILAKILAKDPKFKVRPDIKSPLDLYK